MVYTMGGPAATQANYRISSTESKMLPQPPYKTIIWSASKKGQLKGAVSRLALVYNAKCASLFAMEQFGVEEYAGSQAANVTYNKHGLW